MKTTSTTIADTQEPVHSAVLISQGFCAKKLANKIESGEFVDMAELLPDRLGCSRSFSLEDKGGVPKQISESGSSVSGFTLLL